MDNDKHRGLEKTFHALAQVSGGVQNTDCQSLPVFLCNIAISCVGDRVEWAFHVWVQLISLIVSLNL